MFKNEPQSHPGLCETVNICFLIAVSLPVISTPLDFQELVTLR